MPADDAVDLCGSSEDEDNGEAAAQPAANAASSGAEEVIVLSSDSDDDGGEAAMMAALRSGEDKGVGYLANSPSLSSELRRGDVVSYSGGSDRVKPQFQGVLRRAVAA